LRKRAQKPLSAPQPVQSAAPLQSATAGALSLPTAQQESAKENSIAQNAPVEKLAEQPTKDAAQEQVSVTAQAPVVTGVPAQAGGGGGARLPLAAAAPAPPPAPRFAFDYALAKESLTVTPLAAGFLTVTGSTGTGPQSVLQPPAKLDAGSRTSIAVPPGIKTLTVQFSSKPSLVGAVGGFGINSAFANVQSLPVAPRAAAGKAASAGNKDEQKGRVEQTQPSADPSLSITLQVPEQQ
jgi:hypothetical protein